MTTEIRLTTRELHERRHQLQHQHQHQWGPYTTASGGTYAHIQRRCDCGATLAVCLGPERACDGHHGVLID